MCNLEYIRVYIRISQCEDEAAKIGHEILIVLDQGWGVEAIDRDKERRAV
jgi:hypothetical protein